MSPPGFSEAAETSKAWPFEEARKLIARLERSGRKEAVFETGYGPSGLPHIGTFGEVARTSMVRHAFRVLTGDKIKTRLIAFSDDMDGLRKVPDNIPNRDLILPHLGKPLTQVPDPFGEYDSFAAHNNAMLRAFLDRFGFEYEFMSSTETYKSGRFDKALLRMLASFDEVQAIMLPSLREERAATYSPFLPIHPKTGVVMQAPVIAHDSAAGTIRWRDPETGEEFETAVTGGRCKLQWKPDWAMRWRALGVDYEMAGKDLIDSVKLSSRIARVLGAEPPAGFNYELFLDENGQKISKTKGNGLTIEQWLSYASPESLSLFMFQRPTAAKRLTFDVIPRNVDDYLGFLTAYPRQEWKERLGNPVWHIHAGAPPAPEVLTHDAQGSAAISFAMLLNLAAVANSGDPAVLWGFLRRYAPSASPETHPRLDSLVRYAVAYFRDFVAPRKRYREADEVERGVLAEISTRLSEMPAGANADDIQHALYDIARPIPRYQDFSAKGATAERPGVSNEFFNMVYAVLLGEKQGPRLGSFIAIYGLDETRALIERALSGELVRESRASLDAGMN
ncbi:MAG TPA: lysine--tRNA ligase [Roseiarcus sp.]|nr:lysine--tRNA ligase [Roseiarcus sp.]